MCERAHVKSFSIKVNPENEHIVLRFQGGRLYVEESFDHELCIGGRVVIRRASKTHGVFFCKTCKLRAHVPMPEKLEPDELSEASILAYFRDRFNEEPEPVACHLCGKIDNKTCSMCNPLPPKVKTSEK